MALKSDIEIAQEARPLPITAIAEACGVDEAYLEQYGRYKAKIDNRFLKETARPDGRLVLVTAITPTPAGEGKTTTTVGLADGLRKIGKNAVVALREPSLGPVFGIKGGAAGGGYAQVIPMEDINLHFTGDFHAIGAANNLLAAMLDNHIQQGNALGIDPKQITWRRCVDMNDRQLRNIVDGLGGRMQGVPREDGFDITVASEVMAVLCLASDILDLKARLGRIIVGYTYAGAPVTAHDLKAEGAMAALLKDALKPNLVQTLEHTPALDPWRPVCQHRPRLQLRHGHPDGPEAGRLRHHGGGLRRRPGGGEVPGHQVPHGGTDADAVVLVATVRALKNHGGAAKADLARRTWRRWSGACPTCCSTWRTSQKVFGLPCVVAVNAFPTDTEAELRLVEDKCRELGVRVASRGVGQGRRGRPGPGGGSGAPVRSSRRTSASAMTWTVH